MLGIFTSITLQMKHVESGLLEVHAWPVHDLHEHLSFLLDKAPDYDYTVGWMDTMNGGKSLGRGQIHAANYLHGNEDPNPQKTMQLNNQILPPRIFGVFPKSILYLFMSPFANNLGWWGVNHGEVYCLAAHTRIPPVSCGISFPARLCSQLGTVLRARRIDPVSILPAQRDRGGCLARDDRTFAPQRGCLPTWA